MILVNGSLLFFFFSSRRRHTRCGRDWSSDVCSSDLEGEAVLPAAPSFISAPVTSESHTASPSRSEERRVGKECSSQRWTCAYKKKEDISRSVRILIDSDYENTCYEPSHTLAYRVECY